MFYPKVKLKKSQVSCTWEFRKTFGLFQTGLGILLKAYGPAKGGLVADGSDKPTPLSGLTVLLP